MSELSNHFVLLLLFFIIFHIVSCNQIKLYRYSKEVGDYFKNPYTETTKCDDSDNELCLKTNSKCSHNYPKKGDVCCYCECRAEEGTFNLTNLRCAPTNNFQQGKEHVINCQFDVHTHFLVSFFTSVT